MTQYLLLLFCLAVVVNTSDNYAIFEHKMFPYAKNALEERNPQKLVTTRIHLKRNDGYCFDSQKNVWYVKSGSESLCLKVDTFKGRRLRKIIECDTNQSCFVTVKFERNEFQWRLKEFMSVSDYAKCVSKKMLSNVKKYREKLSAIDKKEFDEIVELCSKIICVLMEHEETAQEALSKFDIEGVLSKDPSKYANVKEKLQETLSFSIKLRDEITRENERFVKMESCGRRMSTAAFLAELDRIQRKGWSDEKKRKAIGNLIDNQ